MKKNISLVLTTLLICTVLSFAIDKISMDKSFNVNNEHYIVAEQVVPTPYSLKFNG